MCYTSAKAAVWIALVDQGELRREESGREETRICHYSMEGAGAYERVESGKPSRTGGENLKPLERRFRRDRGTEFRGKRNWKRALPLERKPAWIIHAEGRHG